MPKRAKNLRRQNPHVATKTSSQTPSTMQQGTRTRRWWPQRHSTSHLWRKWRRAITSQNITTRPCRCLRSWSLQKSHQWLLRPSICSLWIRMLNGHSRRLHSVRASISGTLRTSSCLLRKRRFSRRQCRLAARQLMDARCHLIRQLATVGS